MKKIIIPILFFCAALSANAQEYMHIKSHWHEGYIPVEEIDSISYGEMSHEQMLPAIMAKDPNISIFNKALEITHMGDSLLEMYDYSYQFKKNYIHQGVQNIKFYAIPEIKKLKRTLTE